MEMCTMRLSSDYPAANAAETAFRNPVGRLFHAKQFDVEHQRGVRGNDATGAAGAIAQRGRNDQRTLAADLHAGDAFVPAGDHLALSDRKLERLVAVDRRV